MRKALNENPMVQMTVIGLLIVVGGLFFLTTMKKSDPQPETTTTEASLSSPAGSGDLSVGVTPSSSSASATAPAASSATSGGGTVTPEALIPGPGLPAEVIDAWKGGDAVVLLIVREQGIDDRMVKDSVSTLSGDPGVTVFTVPAEKIADYSRITQGVGVNRVPALVVVRPRTATGSVPEATVSYGFRNAQSVVQAVHDALYEGRDDLSYSPG